MNQSPSTPSFNASVAGLYDEILGPSFFEPYAIETANRVASLQPTIILETACGTGRVTNHLCKKLAKTTKIIATDISEDMLAISKKKLLANKNIALQQADALQLPFQNNYFDVIICQFGAMFFADRKKGFKETWRVLRKRGTFILSVWDKLEYNPVTSISRQLLKDFFDSNPPKNMNLAFSMTDKDEIAELLKECGFVNIRVETVNKICIAESAEALAIATIDGSIISEYIREKDVHAAPILKKKIAEAISEKFGNHPVKGTMQAIIVTCQKPSDN